MKTFTAPIGNKTTLSVTIRHLQRVIVADRYNFSARIALKKCKKQLKRIIYKGLVV